MSTKRNKDLPRHLEPELEVEHIRSPNLGYEAPEETGAVRCLSHGYPTPLSRWHLHEEYELHLITKTSGKAFIGDWIGAFQPGHLVLCGPRLPHNWVSLDVPAGGVAERDLVIQFLHEPFANAAKCLPELKEVLPLLERARHGVEFFGLSHVAQQHWLRVKRSRGIQRFGAFCDFLSDLANCANYRLLSNVRMQGTKDDKQLALIDEIVKRITDNVSHTLTARQLANEFGMSESCFSRMFRRATGNTYTAFVHRVRISRACQLLMNSNRRISQVCNEVGFNNLANFNRRFLEIKGVTPSEFRRQANDRFGVAGSNKSAIEFLSQR